MTSLPSIVHLPLSPVLSILNPPLSRLPHSSSILHSPLSTLHPSLSPLHPSSFILYRYPPSFIFRSPLSTLYPPLLILPLPSPDLHSALSSIHSQSSAVRPLETLVEPSGAAAWRASTIDCVHATARAKQRRTSFPPHRCGGASSAVTSVDSYIPWGPVFSHTPFGFRNTLKQRQYTLYWPL